MPATKLRGKWYVDRWLEIPGRGRKRIRRVSRVQTKRGAEAYERELVEAALLTSVPCGSERRFSEFAVVFLHNYAAVYNKLSEVATKEVLLRAHLIPAFGHLRLSEITTACVDAYAREKLRDGLAAKTINNHLTVLRKALVMAQEWGCLVSVPRVKRLSVKPSEFDFLDFGDAKRLVQAAEPEWAPMITLALNSGLRLGELLALRWRDVDLDRGIITVRQAAALNQIGSPKNGKAREVALNHAARSSLAAHLHQRGELVFCDEDGSLMKRHRPRRPLWRACKRAGLRRIGWHALRHSFASHLVMRGAKLAAVRELMGHSTIEMTMRYAHLSPRVAKETVALLDDPGIVLGSPVEEESKNS